MKGKASIRPDRDFEARSITIRVREACRLTAMGRSKLYMLIKEGQV
jgi:predicted DNA-binding transcriptional regulator AlpA